jgi:hypothetical protein
VEDKIFLRRVLAALRENDLKRRTVSNVTSVT